MNDVFVLLELWCLLLICQILGRRLVYLLPDMMQRTIGFYLAPILGLAALLWLVFLYGVLSPFRWVYSAPLTLAVVCISILLEPKKSALLRHGLTLGLFALLCALPIVAPILRYHGYSPFNDTFTYLAQAQWLQSHPFAEKVMTSGHYPALTQIAAYQNSGSRMGGSFFLAYVQSLFDLDWSYDAYIPTVALGFVAGCLAIGGIIRQVIPVKKIMVLALALLPSLTANGFVFGAEWGFFPQTYGLAFTAGVCALFPYLMMFLIGPTAYPGWAWLQYIFPLALCSAGLLFAYNEPFPIFALAVSLFVLITWCTTRKTTQKICGFLAIYVLELLILMHHESIRIAKNLYQTLSISQGFGDIGWPILWSPIQFIAFAFGMKSPRMHATFSLDSLMSEIVAPLILLVMLMGLIQLMRTRPKSRPTLTFLFCVEFVLLLLAIKFRYFALSKSPLEMGHTFLQFKLAKYAAPISFALLGIFAAMLWQRFKLKRVYWIGVYALIAAFGLYWHGWVLSRYFTEPFLMAVNQRHDPFGMLLKLRASVSDISPDKVVHVRLGGEQIKLRQMVAYVLYDRKISSDYRDDGYILGHLPPQDANMPRDLASGLILFKNPNVAVNPGDQSMGSFILQKPPFCFLVMGHQVGGYPTEKNPQGDNWNWVKQAIEIPFTVMGNCQAIKISFQIKTHHDSGLIEVTLKNKLGTQRLMSKLATVANTSKALRHNISSSALRAPSPRFRGEGKSRMFFESDPRHLDMEEASFESPWIVVHDNKKWLLRIHADGVAYPLSPQDTREATFMIKNIRLSSIKTR